MKPIDIGPSDLETVRRVLREHVPGLEVWAFGSRVSWTARETSDLDIALMTTEPLDVMRLADMREAFVQSDLPFRVDIVDWSSTSRAFQNIIERNRVAVQKKTAKSKAGSRWHKTALGDVVDLRISSVDKKTKHNEHAIHLCNYTDVYNNSFIHSDLDFMTATATEREISNCTLNAEDVIITKDSEKYDDIGVPALVRENIPNLVCGYHLAILRPSLSDIDGTYLFYALTTDDAQHQFQSYANGITRFGLRKADIGLIEIPLPPLPDQRVIGHILRTLDDKIELNRQMNKTLEEMARALFKSWFVDFDPVRAKMDGRWRPGESLPGLPAHLYGLFSDSLVDSELGEIPEGWKARALNCWAFVNPESWSRTNVPKEVEYVDLANTKWGVIGSTQHFLWNNAPSRAKRILRSGDTVVGTVRPANGSYSLIATDGLTGSTGFTVLRPVNPRCREFVYLVVTAAENIERLAHRADGAAYPAVRSDVVGETKVVVPRSDHDILDHFSKTVAPLLNKAEFNKTEFRSLAILRDELLPKLISGELDTFQLARERSTTQ